MSTDLSYMDENDVLRTVAVRFYGGVDRGVGVQICVKVPELINSLEQRAYEEYIAIDRTVKDVLEDWFGEGAFEEQSFNLDPKSHIRSRVVNDFSSAFDSFKRVFL